MAIRRERVHLVIDAAEITRGLTQMRAAVEANPCRADEDPIDYLRRLIDAAFWTPEGWED